MQTVTPTNNNTASPQLSQFPLAIVRTECEIPNDRHPSESLRRKFEAAEEDTDGGELEVMHARQAVLETAELDQENFWHALQPEMWTDGGGIEQGTSTFGKGIKDFAKDNQGVNLTQLAAGIDWEGGRVIVDLDYLMEYLLQNNLISGATYDAYCLAGEGLEINTDSYLLQADAMLVRQVTV